ncbi:hypothetical protein CHARACLAT_031702 [Characodon lateralis]|uniref:Uncharacterized protein n=1 Tax=Characodon lateralis TaxID=208331 RepID=A0ABU7F820_9TELE|nr:hypothetical protein [Characodon lateralis]
MPLDAADFLCAELHRRREDDIITALHAIISYLEQWGCPASLCQLQFCLQYDTSAQTDVTITEYWSTFHHFQLSQRFTVYRRSVWVPIFPQP